MVALGGGLTAFRLTEDFFWALSKAPYQSKPSIEICEFELN